MAKKLESNKPKAQIAVDKKAAAEETIRSLEKRFGEGTLVCLGDRVGKKHPSIPTGLYELDWGVLGIGGVPKGRILEIYGDSGAGKTSLTLKIISEAQKLGELVAFVDAENALDPNWADTLGVDVSSLYVCQPPSGESALEVTEALVRSGAYAVVVVDSVAALTPQAEINGEAGESHMGLQARMISQACRKLTAAVAATDCILLFVNQTRMLLSVVYGSPVTTTGGKALKFYSSVRLEVSRASVIKDGDTPIGIKTRIKAAKNRMAAPFRQCEVDLMFDSGFSAGSSLLEAGVNNGAIERAGAWYTVLGQRYQGKEQIIAAFEADFNLYEQVYKAVREKDNEVIAA